MSRDERTPLLDDERKTLAPLGIRDTIGIGHSVNPIASETIILSEDAEDDDCSCCDDVLDEEGGDHNEKVIEKEKEDKCKSKKGKEAEDEDSCACCEDEPESDEHSHGGEEHAHGSGDRANKGKEKEKSVAIEFGEEECNSIEETAAACPEVCCVVSTDVAQGISSLLFFFLFDPCVLTYRCSCRGCVRFGGAWRRPPLAPPPPRSHSSDAHLSGGMLHDQAECA